MIIIIIRIRKILYPIPNSFLESTLTYQKKDSRWEYGIKGTNLLNTTTLNRDSTNELFFSTQAYFVQPRYVLLSVKYDL